MLKIKLNDKKKNILDFLTEVQKYFMYRLKNLRLYVHYIFSERKAPFEYYVAMNSPHLTRVIEIMRNIEKIYRKK